MNPEELRRTAFEAGKKSKRAALRHSYNKYVKASNITEEEFSELDVDVHFGYATCACCVRYNTANYLEALPNCPLQPVDRLCKGYDCCGGLYRCLEKTIHDKDYDGFIKKAKEIADYIKSKMK